jgi:TetR/AcrR family transcriptional regulator, fatty acid metabolism regulator protein
VATDSEQRGRSFIEEARRRQIVQCAIEEIAESGYAQASTMRIAARAGVSRGVISYHFAGRDDLVGAVITTVHLAAAAVMAPTLDAQPTCAGKLAAFIESHAEFIHTHRAHALAGLAIWTSFRTEDGRRLDEVAASAEQPPELAALNPEPFLREGQHRGEFRPFDAHAMAVALRQAIDGAALEVSRDPDFDIRGYARELVELFDLATTRQP